MGEDARRRHSLAALGVAPVLLLLAVAVWFVSDRLVTIWPLRPSDDRMGRRRAASRARTWRRRACRVGLH